LARRLGVLRPRDLDPLGIPREYLSRLVEGGVLLRTGRGLYSLADADTTENHDLARVGKRTPHGVICLLSALRFHDLTTQLPFEVWIAIGVKARAPKVTSPQLRVVRFSGQALAAGVEEHRIEGVPVRIYGVAKTVADCFKFRRKIGLEVALEALRDCWKQRRATMDDLWRYAKVCRVANVMRPYLESLV
jgi:predicted transcriptional regulator of viral defense system